MRRILALFAAAGLVWVYASSRVLSQESDLSNSLGREGLNFSISGIFHRSIGDGLSGPSYIWTMGMGYGFTDQLSLGVRILYGDMGIPAGPGHPVLNATPLAGGGLEAKFLLRSRSRWAPFLTAGYDVATIVNAQTIGYRGDGPWITLGCEYSLSRLWGATTEISYWHLRFGKIYAHEAVEGIFEPFNNGVLTIGFSLRFYPGSSEPRAKVRSEE